jgi:PRTRC genetic system protein B
MLPEICVGWRVHNRFRSPQRPEDKDTERQNVSHPALVFMVRGRELFVRALAENRRPGSDTQLMSAPYWNTDAEGRVCLGSMRVPEGGVRGVAIGME